MLFLVALIPGMAIKGMWGLPVTKKLVVRTASNGIELGSRSALQIRDCSFSMVLHHIRVIAVKDALNVFDLPLAVQAHRIMIKLSPLQI